MLGALIHAAWSRYTYSLHEPSHSRALQPCLQALGILIVLGSCIVKLPQIYNVWKSKSGEGLPVVSSELENYVYLIHVCYGVVNELPPTAYGEAVASWIQNLILLFMLYKFQKCSLLRASSAILVVAAIATPVYSGLISRPVMANLYDMNSSIYLMSKLPMILSAFKEVCHVSCSAFVHEPTDPCIVLYTT